MSVGEAVDKIQELHEDTLEWKCPPVLVTVAYSFDSADEEVNYTTISSHTIAYPF